MLSAGFSVTPLAVLHFCLYQGLGYYYFEASIIMTSYFDSFASNRLLFESLIS